MAASREDIWLQSKQSSTSLALPLVMDARLVFLSVLVAIPSSKQFTSSRPLMKWSPAFLDLIAPHIVFTSSVSTKANFINEMIGLQHFLGKVSHISSVKVTLKKQTLRPGLLENRTEYIQDSLWHFNVAYNNIEAFAIGVVFRPVVFRPMSERGGKLFPV